MSNIEDLKQKIATKACNKQDVFGVTKEVFKDIKVVLSEVCNELRDDFSAKDMRIALEVDTKGEFEARITMAGDTVLFHMHTNVFSFPPSHMVHKSPYVSKQPENGYCGIINVYNFLTDSYRYHRMNDSGYLVARIFVNRERHFFVEGQQQLGFLFNDFATQQLDNAAIQNIIETALLHVIDFDLYTPPYQQVKEVSMVDMQTLSRDLRLKTAKRLGFQFSADDGEVTF